MKHELDSDGLERKDNSTISRAVEHAGIQQRADVTVHRFDVAPDSTRRFADGDRTCPA